MNENENNWLTCKKRGHLGCTLFCLNCVDYEKEEKKNE